MMNVQRRIDELIVLRAAQWYEDLRRGDEGRNEEFVRWVSESPRHMEAFLAVASEAPLIRDALVEGLASGTFDPARVLQSVSPEVLPLPPLANRRSETVVPTPRRRRVSRWIVSLAAAGAVAVVSVGMALYWSASSWDHFETPVGEQRTLQLTEGSVVNLNANSRVDVRFNESRREVRLLRGEATFKVSVDRVRPFRVYAPDVVVEAVGTQFNVYARPDGTTTVSVLEGKVKVFHLSSRIVPSGDTVPVPVAAGEEARVRSNGLIERVEHADVADAVAWQQRKLIFKRTALEEMAAEFNRYNTAAQIRLEGIEPGRFRFTGAFNADDPHSLAALLRYEADLSVRTEGDVIVIRPREVPWSRSPSE